MNSSLSTYWRGIASGQHSSAGGLLLVILLFLPAFLYACIQRIRATMWRRHVFTPKHLPRPVISVGNITVGGTGKTPVTAYIARFLISRGIKVAVLSRGYGGTMEGQTAIVSDGRSIFHTAEECGDEPYLLASTISGLMVVTGTNRYSAGMLAMEKLAPDIFLLDDGFQHLKLYRNLNILLLDGTRPYGNGMTLPAGLLREPRNAEQRADLVLFTRCEPDFHPEDAFTKPFCVARHLLAELIPQKGGSPIRFEALHRKRVLAFAGIAEPQRFFDSLRDMGLNVVCEIPLADHAVYTRSFFDKLAETLHQCDAEYAVTTEKDGVKLHDLPAGLSENILLAKLEFDIEEPSALTGMLLNLLQK